ncbi:MAG: hypothetical protein KGN01_06730 [Patescibacteria group bacterium]|nr:hypothetical protein [Patescibacteria group bacterium]
MLECSDRIAGVNLTQMYGIKKVSGKITALSPLFSGGDEKTGITQSLNRTTYIIDGEQVEIPFISGNEVRGYLRRLIMQDYINSTGFELNLENKAHKQLFHTLFAGGMLQEVESKIQGQIDLSGKRRIFENILPARLLGFSFGNQMIEGKLKVSPMLPICKELKDFLPNGYESDVSVFEMLSKQFQTRRDEIREAKEKDEQAVQMILEHEVFSAGAKFYQEFAVEDPDELCLSTLGRMIELWNEKPYIGGKSSIGYGNLKLNYPAASSSEAYVNFTKLNALKINETLAELADLFA